MLTIFRSPPHLAALLALGLASAASAQTILVPQEYADGNTSYVSGGIGEDEAEAMRQAAANYPLTLELATAAGGPRDAYISDAKVDIRDGSGNPVLSTTTQGPIMLVRLPAGTYTVDVGWHGTQKHKTVELGGERRQHVMLEFPDDPSNH
jgi:hypothetical protein